MKHERKLWTAGIAISWLFAGASLAKAFTYDRGPNYVNMSGARCRPDTAATSYNLIYGAGSVTVNSNMSNVQLFCPIQRRNTTYYGRLDGSSIDQKVGGDYILIRASDEATDQALYCYPFASAIDDGTVFYGSALYLCGNSEGCWSVDPAFTGTGEINLRNPFGSSTGKRTVNWGYVCNVPTNSTLYYSESSIWSNDTFSNDTL